MPAPTASTNPAKVDISKSQGVTIDWEDGHASQYSCSFLRDHCPCATCSNAHGTSQPQAGTQSSNPFVMYQARPRMRDVEMVGRYAVRIVWNDGHDTGLYSWTLLREICPCSSCKPAGTK
jgi:DUF971 family protein